MYRIIPIVIFCLTLTGCGGMITKAACKICKSEQVIEVPLPLELTPQQPLTLPTPYATLVTSEEEEAYFMLSQEDFKLLLDNNKKIENYIIQCNERVLKTKQYYENGLSRFRTDSD